MRDFLAAHFDLLVTLVKVGAIVNLMLLGVGQLTWLERKLSAWLQDRIGPNRVGPFGLLQFLADGIKFITKEEIIPAQANKLLYNLAPVIAVICGLSTIAVVPLGPDFKINLLGGERVISLTIAPGASFGLLWVLALTSMGVYAIMLAGWASNSKYPQLGGLRSTAQIISYEIAMGLAIVPVVMKAGSLSLAAIIDSQSGWGWNLFSPQALGFLIFMTASFAETNRLPFDLPEGEAELVGGYHTEYSGMKFASFFMAEYANMMVAACMMVVLFFGGWRMPWMHGGGGSGGVTEAVSLFSALAGVIWFSLKVFAFLFFFIWVRWTLPRFRYDQLMKLGWVYFIPMALINLALAAVWLFWFRNS